MDKLISWIESYLPGALPKWILVLSILLSQALYKLFPDLPKSWLPQTEEQTFLTRLLLSGLILLIGFVSLVALLMRHNRKLYVSFISQLYLTHENYKSEIEDINKQHDKQLGESLRLTREVIDLYEKKVDRLIQDNRPLGLLSQKKGGFLAAALRDYKKPDK